MQSSQDPKEQRIAEQTACAERLAEQARVRVAEPPPRFAEQSVHLTVPATNWKMTAAAVEKSQASLVMLDLEDSIPRDDDEALGLGRTNIVRALRELDWGNKLRFFRPRGVELDPSCEDLRSVVAAAGQRLEGIVLPKGESPDEVKLIDEVLTDLESQHGLASGQIRMSVLIESAAAEEASFAIAAASPRIISLVLGAYDYWSSLGMGFVPYRFDHPLVDQARCRIVKAAASIGAQGIAEMSTNYPTKEKSEAERTQALADCRRDAEHARELGMRGKWVGHPGQIPVVRAVFEPSPLAIEQAAFRVRAFREAESRGLGAVILEGNMVDRATDRVDRTTLVAARRLGLLTVQQAELLD